MLVLALALVGAWRYAVHKAEKRQLAQESKQKQDEERIREGERRELERRIEEDKKQHDVLQASSSALDSLLARWSDAAQVASTTSRIALSGPVATMQSLRREAEQLKVSPCMDLAKAHLVASMGDAIEAFLVFMRNEMGLGEAMAQSHFADSRTNLQAFKAARADCRQ